MTARLDSEGKYRLLLQVSEAANAQLVFAGVLEAVARSRRPDEAPAEMAARAGKAGQPAVLEVDAYPGVDFHGKVESIAAATGAKFALSVRRSARPSAAGDNYSWPWIFYVTSRSGSSRLF